MDDTNSSQASADNAQDTSKATEEMNAALIADDDTEATSNEDKDTQASESEESKGDEDAEAESEEKQEDNSEDDKSEDDSDDAEGEESGDAEETTNDPKELARRAYKEREERRRTEQEERRKQEDQLNEYVDQAETDQDKALRQLQVESYRTRIQSNTERLVNSYEKAVSQIELFQNPSPEVKRMLDKAIDNYQAQNVQIDAYGNPYEVSGDLYQYLQSEAEDIAALTQTGARQENRNRAKTRSKAMRTPARQKPAPKTDPVMAELLKDD